MDKISDYSRFIKLVTESREVLERASHKSSEENRNSIISAMKLSKLMVAEKRSQESLSLYLDLTTKPEAILEALGKASTDITSLGNLLSYNNEIYFRVLKYISDNKS